MEEDHPNRYHLLFERHPFPMWVFDRETLRFLDVNGAAVAHYGYSHEEFLAMTIADIRPAEDVPELMAAFDRMPPRGHAGMGLFRHRKKDGTVFEVEITSSPTEFGGRAARAVVAIDVTERRRLEAERDRLTRELAARDVAESRRAAEAQRASAEALRASEERLRLALAGAGLGTWEQDLPTDLSTFDERTAALIGWPAGEPRMASGADRLATIHPDDRARVLEAFSEAVASEDGDYAVEYRAVWPDGVSYRWVAVRAAVQRDPSGRPYRVVGVMRDVTAEREAAARQRRFLREMLYSLTEGRLRLLEDAAEAPGLLPPAEDGGPYDLSVPDALRSLRRAALTAAEAAGFSEERRHDLETALTEAATNALKHAGGGQGGVHADPAAGVVQVVVRDAGAGIPDDHIHRATLDKGYSTAGTLGHGFWLMLRTADRIHLLTGPEGTTVIVEQFRTTPDPVWLRAAPDLESFPTDPAALLVRKLQR